MCNPQERGSGLATGALNSPTDFRPVANDGRDHVHKEKLGNETCPNSIRGIKFRTSKKDRVQKKRKSACLTIKKLILARGLTGFRGGVCCHSRITRPFPQGVVVGWVSAKKGGNVEALWRGR